MRPIFDGTAPGAETHVMGPGHGNWPLVTPSIGVQAELYEAVATPIEFADDCQCGDPESCPTCAAEPPMSD